MKVTDYTVMVVGTVLPNGSVIGKCPICGKNGRMLNLMSGGRFCDHRWESLESPGEGVFGSTK